MEKPQSKLNLSRQTDLINTFKANWLVIGAGAIGSNAVVTLAKMGFGPLTVYDNDVVNEENLAPGAFDSRMMGKPKVKAIDSLVKLMLSINVVVPKFELYTDQKEDAQVVVMGVDSLEARIAIMDVIATTVSGVKYVIDGRIGGHNSSVYCVDMTNQDRIENYIKTLHVEAAPLPCGMKATRYIVDWCTSSIGNAARAIANGQPVPYIQHWSPVEGQSVIITPTI